MRETFVGSNVCYLRYLNSYSFVHYMLSYYKPRLISIVSKYLFYATLHLAYFAHFQIYACDQIHFFPAYVQCILYSVHTRSLKYRIMHSLLVRCSVRMIDCIEQIEQDKREMCTILFIPSVHLMFQPYFHCIVAA